MKTQNLIIGAVIIGGVYYYMKQRGMTANLIAQARTNTGALVDTSTPDNVGALGLL